MLYSDTKCIDYVEKWPFIVIFYINYTFLESVFEPCYIQNHVITNHVIKRLCCIYLFASTVFLKASQNCSNLIRRTINNILRKWHYSAHSLASLMSLYVVKSTVSLRYDNVFHLVGFISLLAAVDIRMKCNIMGSSLKKQFVHGNNSLIIIIISSHWII